MAVLHMEKLYTIGQLAKASDTSADTLRYYEQQSLISSQRSDNGYRQFSQTMVEQLHFIQQAKALGFSLAEIKTLLSLKNNQDATCQNVKALAQQKLQVIEEKIADLQNIHRMLSNVNDQCEGGADSVDHCNIMKSLEQQNSSSLQ